MVEPSAYSQYMLELINRARLNPAAEASLHGIDLNEGLNPNTISNSSKQPLAFNPLLIDAANFHSQWMLNTDTFSHAGVGGDRAGDRITDAGYQYTTWGENIGYTGTTGNLNRINATASVHQSLFKSSGHRRNILRENFREIGLATTTGDFKGFNALMVTQAFATSHSNAFLTGVVFNDEVNDNDFYTVGEGLGDIAITAVHKSNGNSFSTETMSAGGYQLALEPGTYNVTFTVNNQEHTTEATIGSSNVKLDLNTEDLPSSDVNDPNLLFGSQSHDFIQGHGGNDTIYGDRGNDTLEGNRDSDRLYGGWGHDVVRGGHGNDYLYLGIDNDFATGDDGHDYIQGEWGEDTIYGGSGNDTINGNQNSDRLYGGWGDDVVRGGNGDDYLYLGIDNDFAEGGSGNDYIQGEWGNDTLAGGVGADTLQGNQNNDTFVYFSSSDSSLSQPDTIVDFTPGSDKLQFNFSLAPTIGSVNSLNEANAYFTGSSQLAFSAVESILYVDSTAQGVVDMAIKLENVTALNLGDFV